MIIYFIIGCLLFAFYQIFRPLYHLIRLKLKHGSDGVLMFFPLIGDIYQFQAESKKYGDPLLRMHKLMVKPPYPKFRFSNLFNQPLIGINDPQYYKQILLEHEKFPKWNSILHLGLASKGMVMQEGQKWHQQRKLLSQSFTYDGLIGRLPLMNQICQKYIENIQINSIETLQNITGEIVSKSFFHNTDTSFLKRVPSIVQQLGLMRFTNPVFLIKNMIFGMRAWKIFPTKQEQDIDNYITLIKDQLQQLIQERIDQYKNSKEVIQKTDFLEVHLKYYMDQNIYDPQKMDIDEIIQQFITLYLAGTDTTAYSCANVLYFLGSHQHYQYEIYEEVQSVLQGETTISKDHINKMSKLWAFIQESLRYNLLQRFQRLKPPGARLMLRYAKEDVKIQDLEIKKGWFIMPDNFTTRMSDKYIDDPLVFNYKRWLTQNNPYKNDDSYANLTFSAGSRNCIGQHMAKMEMIIILSNIIQRFKVELQGQQIWEIKFIYSFSPMNSIKFIPRSK